MNLVRVPMANCDLIRSVDWVAMRSWNQNRISVEVLRVGYCDDTSMKTRPPGRRTLNISFSNRSYIHFMINVDVRIGLGGLESWMGR